MVRDISERRDGPPLSANSMGGYERSRMDEMEPFGSSRGMYYSNSMNQDGLTNRVWPKTRMLLAIASRMYKEKVINLEQRGKLKDLILDSDRRLETALNEYYLDSDRNLLYQNLISLI